MQRSSESIASLAAALAKAQIELANPEKSLVGTIEPQAGEGSQRLFRYAPLSSGLEIVRKTLGQHEIATLQTTAIDQTAGIVNLTTILAHASGEWIASDWPVCAISETARPRRMGAALTYARRYALFTLVGIAGEDDLDAPDLATPAAQGSRGSTSRAGQKTGRNGNGSGMGRVSTFRSAKATATLPRQSLAPPQSALRRDLLLSDLETLNSADAAAAWAQRALPVKDSLTPADAKRVEEAFQNTLSTFDHCDAPVASALFPASGAAQAQQPSTVATEPDWTASGSAGSIDKTALAFAEPRRIRDREHLQFVAKQPCLVCGRSPCDPHHLRFAQARALGRKASDEFAVPLCRGHHRELHRCGDEAGWWKKSGIDPMPAARLLWRKTHPIRDGAALTPMGASAGGNGATPPRSRRRASPGKRRCKNETNPIAAAAAQP